MKQLIWDTEILGKNKPVFLLRAYCPQEEKSHVFWFDKKGHMDKLWALMNDESYEWVGFNSKKFDSVITSAVVGWGMTPEDLKNEIVPKIIEQRLQPFQIYRTAFHEAPPFDDNKKTSRYAKDEEASRHIDLFDVAPGVKTSLKVYMARMHAETLQDLPYHHDEEIDTPKKRKVVEDYCHNDIRGTYQLWLALQEEVALRRDLSSQFKLDLMSKSDAQMAEAIFKKMLDLPKAPSPPEFIRYKLPKHIIKTRNRVLQDLIAQAEGWDFEINQNNGSPIQPDWMADGLIAIGAGRYKFGLGGLHSEHDQQLYVHTDDDHEVSDFDAASYYPNIIVKCGFIPNMAGAKGEQFIDLFCEFLARRMGAKRDGIKKVANALKILLNGTFGKLGSMFSRLYAPDLLLGVTITGQLNLLCIIDELVKIPGVTVLSANTDGIMVKFPRTGRAKVEAVFAANSKRTGFEYEETPYRTVALRDVNNYIAISIDGKVKGKGVHSDVDSKPEPLKTHRSFTICSKAALEFIRNGTPVEKTINECKDIRDFVSMANGDGQSGGLQTVRLGTFDDWVEVEPKVWENHIGKISKRKSRPGPYEAAIPGSEEKIGRIARWYISQDPDVPPIRTVKGLRQVPLTEGGRLCMTLPKSFPKDVDRKWYINRAKVMLKEMGVPV